MALQHKNGSCSHDILQIPLYTKLSGDDIFNTMEKFKACILQTQSTQDQCLYKCEMYDESVSVYEVYVMANIWYKYNPKSQICDVKIIT